MNQVGPNQGGNPMLSGPRGRSPAQVAQAVGIYVKAFVILVFWAVVAVAALCAGYVGLKGVWWATQVVLQAVGV